MSSTLRPSLHQVAALTALDLRGALGHPSFWILLLTLGATIPIGQSMTNFAFSPSTSPAVEIALSAMVFGSAGTIILAAYRLALEAPASASTSMEVQLLHPNASRAAGRLLALTVVGSIAATVLAGLSWASTAILAPERSLGDVRQGTVLLSLILHLFLLASLAMFLTARGPALLATLLCTVLYILGNMTADAASGPVATLLWFLPDFARSVPNPGQPQIPPLVAIQSLSYTGFLLALAIFFPSLREQRR